MRISRVQAFLCDAGWRPWVFVKVETDDGLVGWGECFAYGGSEFVVHLHENDTRPAAAAERSGKRPDLRTISSRLAFV